MVSLKPALKNKKGVVSKNTRRRKRQDYSFAREEAAACTGIQRRTSGLYMECSCLLRLTPSCIILFSPTQPQSDLTAKDLESGGKKSVITVADQSLPCKL